MLFLMTISVLKIQCMSLAMSNVIGSDRALTMWAVSHRLIPNFIEIITEFLACQIMSPFQFCFSQFIFYILSLVVTNAK